MPETVLCESKEVDLSPGTLEIAESAFSKCSFGNSDLILDAGSGFGKTTEYLEKVSGLKTVSIDISMENLIKTRKKASNTSTLCSDLNLIPVKDSVFKGIISQCVLSLMDDKKKVLYEFNRVLKNEGVLIISDIFLKDNSMGNDKSSNIKSCLNGAVTLELLYEILDESGFIVKFTEDKTLLLKEMACQIIFDHGTLSNYMNSVSKGRVFPNNFCGNIYNYKYYLIIAGKK